eukprot:GGOE01012756.1.p4 GENE.GGOE01012756.1~~GGOE01012756.1.p4  ORF type:complete len:156 (-),score=1.45 GGOE01012756.1:266-733(-)
MPDFPDFSVGQSPPLPCRDHCPLPIPYGSTLPAIQPSMLSLSLCLTVPLEAEASSALSDDVVRAHGLATSTHNTPRSRHVHLIRPQFSRGRSKASAIPPNHRFPVLTCCFARPSHSLLVTVAFMPLLARVPPLDHFFLCPRLGPLEVLSPAPSNA